MSSSAFIVPSVAMKTIATATIRNAIRDRTVVWLALMFMAMVLLSAYLGWVGDRYDQSDLYQGKPCASG